MSLIHYTGVGRLSSISELAAVRAQAEREHGRVRDTEREDRTQDDAIARWLDEGGR